MTNQEILTKAIEKGIAGGWFDPFGIVQFKLPYGVGDNEWSVAHKAICIRSYSRNTKKMEDNYFQNEMFIFNHDFAKALWPLPCLYNDGREHNNKCVAAWQYHLQQMVIADDPIKYLGEHI